MLREMYYKIERVFPFINILRILYLKLTHKKPKRYNYLFEFIKQNKCKQIMEIGVWNGFHALQMIKAAQEASPFARIKYFGFDLFENFNITNKLNGTKIPSSLAVIENKLKKTGAEINLYKGYTQDTLWAFPYIYTDQMDFIFIDGGHSRKTIATDWFNIQELMDDKTIVIFDDYWNRIGAGCKTLIDNLDRDKFNVEILPVVDKFKKDWGVLEIRFVKVQRRQNAS